MTNATNTADGSNGKNTLSPFAIAMSDVFSLNAKIEGTSVKLLHAMYNSEATFDITWLERYAKASGKPRSEILDKVLLDTVPSYGELKDTADAKLGEIKDASERAKLADRKSDAQRKLKTAQNILRNVILCVSFLRIGPANRDEKTGKLSFKTPVTKIDVKNGKVRFATSEGWYSAQYSSIAELTKYGANVIDDMGWNVKVAGTPRAGAASSAKATAEKAKATGGYFNNAINELSKALIGVISSAEYDKLPESELESLRNLEAAMIRKVYADAKGYIDIEALVETCEALNERKNKAETKAEEPKVKAA